MLNLLPINVDFHSILLYRTTLENMQSSEEKGLLCNVDWGGGEGNSIESTQSTWVNDRNHRSVLALCLQHTRLVKTCTLHYMHL